MAFLSQLCLNVVMYPDQNPQNQPLPPTQPTDYLDQISSKPPRPSLFQLDKRFLFIGGLVLIIIIVAITAVVANSGRGVPNAELLGARLSSLSTLIKYGEGSNITDSNVKQLVAEISLVQASGKKQLAIVFGGDSGFSKPSDQVKAQESVTTLTKELDEAKKTGSINTLFKEALLGKVKSIIALLQNSLDDISSASSQNIVKVVISNFQTILDRFTD